MKRTLITIVLTAVVVLTLVGLVSSQFMLGSPLASRSQEFGFGGGGGVDLYAASPPIAEQPAAPEDISKSANQAGEMQTAVNRLVI